MHRTAYTGPHWDEQVVTKWEWRFLAAEPRHCHIQQHNQHAIPDHTKDIDGFLAVFRQDYLYPFSSSMFLAVRRTICSSSTKFHGSPAARPRRDIDQDRPDSPARPAPAIRNSPLSFSSNNNMRNSCAKPRSSKAAESVTYTGRPRCKEEHGTRKRVV
jgi:hypothetical protein